MKTNEKVISLSAAKKLSYLDDLDVRAAEEARLAHMRSLQLNPPSAEMLSLAEKLSNPDSFEKEFEIFNMGSRGNESK